MDLLMRAVVVALVVAVVGVLGLWWQRRDGKVVAADESARFSVQQLAAVGLDLNGDSAGAVLLGSPSCHPCATVKQILIEVAAERDGFSWVDVDAAAHLELAQAHRVLRVPTLFLLDGRGRILARSSGVPGKREVLAILDRGEPRRPSRPEITTA